jgi:acetoacetate decarboxylase
LRTQANLKLIPCVTGALRIAELVAYNIAEVTMKFHYAVAARSG